MDADILCQLLAKRIPPEQFQVHGLDVRWMNEAFDTEENRAIVREVTGNYGALSEAHLAGKHKAADNTAICAELAAIDLKSVRSIREWVVKQSDAPQFLKDHEGEAVNQRTKLKEKE